MGSSEGSTLQSVGLQVIATMPRSPRIGRRRRASAVVIQSMSMSAARPRAISRPSCSASRSVRAILRAPLWVNLSGWLVSSVNAASLTTARRASFVSDGVARIWLVSPAARGEVWEARAARSSSATRAPRRARWYAALAPKAPEPTTTASAEAIMATAPGSARPALDEARELVHVLVEEREHRDRAIQPLLEILIHQVRIRVPREQAELDVRPFL